MELANKSGLQGFDLFGATVRTSSKTGVHTIDDLADIQACRERCRTGSYDLQAGPINLNQHRISTKLLPAQEIGLAVQL
ncbi:MAG: hypothetical protein LQ349_003615 [Xanthoria aureola]|nr:MAG: hypothetical protein LQ349_003615 [Xanthoria aureola]